MILLRTLSLLSNPLRYADRWSHPSVAHATICTFQRVGTDFTFTVCTTSKNLVLHIKVTWSIARHGATCMVAGSWKYLSRSWSELWNNTMASPSSPFPSLKTTGDNKHDMELYVEDLIDGCVMHQNWYDPAKETEAATWIKPDKAMACLEHLCMSPAARSTCK